MQTIAMLAPGMIVSAQEKELPALTFSGYAEVYYQYDANRPANHTRPAFVYSHNRTDEVNLNLAYIRASYNRTSVRANVALAAGTYMNANYSAEPGVLKNIFEANIGFKLLKKQDLWFDAGIMPSHIGFENAIGKENWTLTRSMMADNSPYFETGAKLTYTSSNEQWLLSALILNGWQRIQRPDGNRTPAVGHQLTFKPDARWILNSSSFIGSDRPDSTRRLRYFHNFYTQFLASDKWNMTAGFDVGAEQQQKGSKQYNIWYTPVLLVRYKPLTELALTVRGEYYDDHRNVVTSIQSTEGLQSLGYSLNADYYISDNMLCRMEYRSINNRQPAFLNKHEHLSKSSNSVTAVMAISF